MKNPLIKKIPFTLNMKIRMCVLLLWMKKHAKNLSLGFVGLLVPAMAVFVFLVLPQNDPTIDIGVLVAEARAAQVAEVARGSEQIYHTKMQITEGEDKPQFVRSVLEAEVLEVPKRTDVIETWHHNDTALALIESNGTERSFEAFLSRSHEEDMLLHHYGPKDSKRPEARRYYDEAHDLATLYTSFTSLERPQIPVLPDNAEFLSYDEENNILTFTESTSDGLEIEYDVRTDNYQLIEERIFVRADEERYEMTRITFLERSIIDAGEFETVFDPTQYDYEVVSA